MSDLSPIPNLDYDPERGYRLPDVTKTPYPAATGREIRVVKPNESAIIPDHKAQLLRRIGNAQAEIGRLNKLLDEIRADVLHLTTE
jgi:hypothetical protein